jgi:hypothetical protein
MVEPTTYQSEDDGPQSDIENNPWLAAAVGPPLVADEQRGDHTDKDEQRVRPDGDEPQMPNALGRARERSQ